MARNNTLHLAPFQPEVLRKAQQREEISDAIAAFLAKGGKIDALAHGERAPEAPVKRRGKAAKKAGINRHFLSKLRSEPTLAEETRLEELAAEEEAAAEADPEFEEA